MAVSLRIWRKSKGLAFRQREISPDVVMSLGGSAHVGGSLPAVMKEP